MLHTRKRRSRTLDIDTGSEIKGLRAFRVSDNTVDMWAVGYAPGFTGRTWKTQVYLP